MPVSTPLLFNTNERDSFMIQIISVEQKAGGRSDSLKSSKDLSGILCNYIQFLSFTLISTKQHHTNSFEFYIYLFKL